MKTDKEVKELVKIHQARVTQVAAQLYALSEQKAALEKELQNQKAIITTLETMAADEKENKSE